MINITFSLLDNDDILSGYELGDIEIKYENIVISSVQSTKLSGISRSFMVFISISELLDQFKKFYVGRKTNDLSFIFVDSSFYLIFKRKGEYLSIQNENTVIENLSINDFSNQLYSSCKNIYMKVKSEFEDNNPVYMDLKNSLDMFYNNIISNF